MTKDDPPPPGAEGSASQGRCFNQATALLSKLQAAADQGATYSMMLTRMALIACTLPAARS
jgi:hypothetical protein